MAKTRPPPMPPPDSQRELRLTILEHKQADLEPLGLAVCPHVHFLLDDLLEPCPRIQSPPIRDACRAVLRTYSDLHYNILIATAPWGDTWYGRHPGCARTGAIMASSPKEFMKNRYTWVSMRSDPYKRIADCQDAQAAVIESTGPARVALLLRDERCIRQFARSKTQGVRKYILISIARSTKQVVVQDNPDQIDRRKNHQYKFQEALSPYIVLVMENKQAPTYDTVQLHGILGKIPGLQITGHKCHAEKPPDIIAECTNSRLSPLNNPLHWHGHLWLRPAHYTCEDLKLNNDTENTVKVKSKHLHRILALLGILPPQFEKRLAAHWEAEIGEPTMKAIASMIRYSTLDLFRKDEAFRKWKRKGIEWRS